MHTHTGELPTFSAPADADAPGARFTVMLGGVFLLVSALSWATWGRPAEKPYLSPTVAVRSTTGIVASLDGRASHNGRYQARVTAVTPFVLGEPQRWVIRLTGPGQRHIANARIAVKSWAPETGEVARFTPSARDVGRGRYVVDDIYFNSPGLWNVALVVDGAAGVDSLAFNVIMPTSAPASR